MEDKTTGVMKQLNFYRSQREDGWWANVFLMEGFKIEARIVALKGDVPYRVSINAITENRSFPIKWKEIEEVEEGIEFIETWGHEFYQRRLMGNWLM